jgi:UDP-glucose 4-epimerase
VRVLDDLSTGSLSNLAGTEIDDMIIGDIRDQDTVRQAVTGVGVIYHLAALPSVQRSLSDPERTHHVNVDGTLNVLLAARDAGVDRIIYASSSSVYGDTPTLPKHEQMVIAPLSPYAASKLSGEVYCRAFAHAFGMKTTCLRFFNVFGPRQDPDSQYAAVIPRFIGRMMAGDPPEIYGDGSQTRDFTFVGNAIQACLLAAGAGPGAIGEVINIACGQRISLLQLVELLNDSLGTAIQPVHSAPKEGDVRHSLADIEKARGLLGYRPLVGLRDGVAQTVEWFSIRMNLAARANVTIDQAS